MTTLLTALLAGLLVPLGACVGGGSTKTPADHATSPAPSPLLRVESTVDVPAAGNVLSTGDRLWVISGGKAALTQIDPDTNRVTRRVVLPHPVAYGTVAQGSLWVVSYGENALFELDAKSGKVLKRLERSPALPLDAPVGVAVTGQTVWVLNHSNSKLLRIDAQTGTLIQTTRMSGDAAAGPFLVGDALWIAMTAQGIVYKVDPGSGKVVDRPIHVPTGLCAWESVVGHDIWATSRKFADFNCVNGTSRIDTSTGQVDPLTSAEDKSLYTFARYAGRVWATDTRQTVYQLNQHTGTLIPAMTFADRDANHLFSAFGSLWMTRSGNGQLLRLRAT